MDEAEILDEGTTDVVEILNADEVDAGADEAVEVDRDELEDGVKGVDLEGVVELLEADDIEEVEEAVPDVVEDVFELITEDEVDEEDEAAADMARLEVLEAEFDEDGGDEAEVESTAYTPILQLPPHFWLASPPHLAEHSASGARQLGEAALSSLAQWHWVPCCSPAYLNPRV